MLVLEDKKKPISSRDGMKLCVETSTTFDDWVRQSEKDYQEMLVYLKENDFAGVGGLTGKMPAMHAGSVAMKNEDSFYGNTSR